MAFKITIVTSRTPQSSNLNEMLQWFGGSLGLFGIRDKDKSQFRIFIELLKYSRTHQEISSDELAERLGLTRGTVMHHINKLVDSGIVVIRRSRYLLRVDSLSALVDLMQADLEKSLQMLRTVAKEIDSQLEIKK